MHVLNISTYDDRGKLLSVVNEFDSQADGIVDGFTRTDFQYESADDVTRETQKADSDGDGIVDEIRTTTRTYAKAAALR